MINSKDIRRGNYIIDPEFLDIHSIVDEIQSDGFIVTTYNDHLTNEEAAGILLNDEWLSKLDVSKNNGYPHRFLSGYLKIRNGTYFFKYFDLDIEVQFVHQLQNLHYCLTGKELECVH